MKIGVTLGATLSLGNYNTARASIVIEDEYMEKDFQVMVDENTGSPVARQKAIELAIDEVYQQVEDNLMSKIAQLIVRLEEEKYV